MKNINDNLINENNALLNEINSLKTKNKQIINNFCISPQNNIYFKNCETKTKNNKTKVLEICKKINNISILNKKKLIKSRNNSLVERKANSINNFYNFQDSEINNKLKNFCLTKKGDKLSNKNFRLIIVKKINFFIKRVPKTEED